MVNERFTDAAADDMWAGADVRWGLFGVPDRDLGVLGDVSGLDVLELACGTAYFSAWLARAGARVVATDLSGEQPRPRGGCNKAKARTSRSSRRTPNGPRSRTDASISS